MIFVNDSVSAIAGDVKYWADRQEPLSEIYQDQAVNRSETD